MSFRDVTVDVGARLAELERQVRSLQARVGELEAKTTMLSPPDPGWQLSQVGTDLYYLYVPTGTYGPVIGSQ
jgi:hypothetical protein